MTRPGPKPLPAGARRDRVIHTRVRPAEEADAKALAAAQGVSLSDLLRNLLLQALANARR